jgi:Tol biopolymer transport system component
LRRSAGSQWLQSSYRGGPWAVSWYFSELFVVDADGSGLRRLTENAVGDRWPQWTPDGRILLVSNRAGPDDLTNGDESEYYVMNAGGSGVEVFRWDPSYS